MRPRRGDLLSVCRGAVAEWQGMAQGKLLNAMKMIVVVMVMMLDDYLFLYYLIFDVLVLCCFLLYFLFGMFVVHVFSICFPGATSSLLTKLLLPSQYASI